MANNKNFDDFGDDDFDYGEDEFFPLGDFDSDGGKDSEPGGIRSYAKNLGKTVKTAAMGLGDALFPSVTNMVRELDSAKNNTIQRSKDGLDKVSESYRKKTAGKALGSIMKDSLKEVLGDFAKAAKTGDFTFGTSDDDFSMDSMFGDDSWGDEDDSSNDSKLQLDSTYKKSAEHIVTATVKSTQANLNMQQEVFKAGTRQNAKLHVRSENRSDMRHLQNVGYMANIDSNVGKIVRYLGTVGQTSAQAAMEFSTKSLGLQQDTIKLLNQINKNTYVPKFERENKGKSVMNDIFGFGFNGEGYSNAVMDNIKGWIEDSPIGQIAGSLGMLGSMQGMMGKKSAGNALMELVLPEIPGLFMNSKVKDKLGRFNETVEGLPTTINTMFNTIANTSDNPLLRTLSSFLGVKELSTNKFKTGFDDKELNAKANFDKRFYNSVTQAIPGLLSKILAVNSGSEEIYFDHKLNTFRKSSFAIKEYKYAVKNIYEGNSDMNALTDKSKIAGEKYILEGNAELKERADRLKAEKDRINELVRSEKISKDSKEFATLQENLAKDQYQYDMDLGKYSKSYSADVDQIIKNIAGLNYHFTPEALMRDGAYQKLLTNKLKDKNNLLRFVESFRTEYTQNDQELFTRSMNSIRMRLGKFFNEEVQEMMNDGSGSSLLANYIQDARQTTQEERIKILDRSGDFAEGTLEHNIQKAKTIKAMEELKISAGGRESTIGNMNPSDVGFSDGVAKAAAMSPLGVLSNIYELLLGGIFVFPKDGTPKHLTDTMENYYKNKTSVIRERELKEENENAEIAALNADKREQALADRRRKRSYEILSSKFSGDNKVKSAISDKLESFLDSASNAIYKFQFGENAKSADGKGVAEEQFEDVEANLDTFLKSFTELMGGESDRQESQLSQYLETGRLETVNDAINILASDDSLSLEDLITYDKDGKPATEKDKLLLKYYIAHDKTGLFTAAKRKLNDAILELKDDIYGRGIKADVDLGKLASELVMGEIETVKERTISDFDKSFLDGDKSSKNMTGSKKGKRNTVNNYKIDNSEVVSGLSNIFKVNSDIYNLLYTNMSTKPLPDAPKRGEVIVDNKSIVDAIDRSHATNAKFFDEFREHGFKTFGNMNENMFSLKETFGKMFGSFEILVAKIFSGDLPGLSPEAVEEMKKNLRDTTDKGKGIFKKVINYSRSGARYFAEKAKYGIGKVFGVSRSVINKSIEMGGKVFNTVKGGVKSGFKGARNLLKSVSDFLTSDSVKDGTANLGKGAMDSLANIGRGGSKFLESAIDGAGKFGKNVLTTGGNLLETASTVGKDTITSASETIKRGVSKFTNKIFGIGNSVSDEMNSVERRPEMSEKDALNEILHEVTMIRMGMSKKGGGRGSNLIAGIVSKFGKTPENIEEEIKIIDEDPNLTGEEKDSLKEKIAKSGSSVKTKFLSMYDNVKKKSLQKIEDAKRKYVQITAANNSKLSASTDPIVENETHTTSGGSGLRKKKIKSEDDAQYVGIGSRRRKISSDTSSKKSRGIHSSNSKLQNNIEEVEEPETSSPMPVSTIRSRNKKEKKTVKKGDIGAMIRAAFKGSFNAGQDAGVLMIKGGIGAIKLLGKAIWGTGILFFKAVKLILRLGLKALLFGIMAALKLTGFALKAALTLLIGATGAALLATSFAAGFLLSPIKYIILLFSGKNKKVQPHIPELVRRLFAKRNVEIDNISDEEIEAVIEDVTEEEVIIELDDIANSETNAKNGNDTKDTSAVDKKLSFIDKIKEKWSKLKTKSSENAVNSKLGETESNAPSSKKKFSLKNKFESVKSGIADKVRGYLGSKKTSSEEDVKTGIDPDNGFREGSIQDQVFDNNEGSDDSVAEESNSSLKDIKKILGTYFNERAEKKRQKQLVKEMKNGKVGEGDGEGGGGIGGFLKRNGKLLGGLAAGAASVATIGLVAKKGIFDKHQQAKESGLYENGSVGDIAGNAAGVEGDSKYGFDGKELGFSERSTQSTSVLKARVPTVKLLGKGLKSGFNAVKGIGSKLGAKISKHGGKIGKGIVENIQKIPKMISDFINRLLNSKKLAKFIKPGVAAKVSAAIPKILKPSMLKGIGSKIFKKLASLIGPIGIALTINDFLTGMNSTSRYFGLGKGAKPTISMRLTSGLANVLSSLLFGLIPTDLIVTTFHSIFGSSEEKEYAADFKKFTSAKAGILGVPDGPLSEFETKNIWQGMMGSGKKDAAMLGFGQDAAGMDAFNTWKSTKYEAVEKLRAKLSKQFGGDGVTGGVPSSPEDAERQRLFREKFLSEAAKLVKSLPVTPKKGEVSTEDSDVKLSESNDDEVAADAKEVASSEKVAPVVSASPVVSAAPVVAGGVVAGGVVAGSVSAAVTKPITTSGGAIDTKLSPNAPGGSNNPLEGDAVKAVKKDLKLDNKIPAVSAAVAATVDVKQQVKEPVDQEKLTKAVTEKSSVGQPLVKAMTGITANINTELDALRAMYAEQTRHNGVSESFFSSVISALLSIAGTTAENFSLTKITNELIAQSLLDGGSGIGKRKKGDDSKDSAELRKMKEAEAAKKNEGLFGKIGAGIKDFFSGGGSDTPDTSSPVSSDYKQGSGKVEFTFDPVTEKTFTMDGNKVDSTNDDSGEKTGGQNDGETNLNDFSSMYSWGSGDKKEFSMVQTAESKTKEGTPNAIVAAISSYLGANKAKGDIVKRGGDTAAVNKFITDAVTKKTHSILVGDIPINHQGVLIGYQTVYVPTSGKGDILVLSQFKDGSRQYSINNSSELAKAANVDVTKGKYGAGAQSTIMNVNTSAAAKSASNTQNN